MKQKKSEAPTVSSRGQTTVMYCAVQSQSPDGRNTTETQTVKLLTLFNMQESTVPSLQRTATIVRQYFTDKLPNTFVPYDE